MSASYHFSRILVHGRALVTGQSPERRRGPFDVFLEPEALAMNAARQEHLASLGLDFAGKSVLEVGAGIGLLTPFFLERGSHVVVTDGREENVAEIRRRLPGVRAEVLDLDAENVDFDGLGQFDFVHCYGLLYHLANPERALKRMAAACRGQLLLETGVSLGRYAELQKVRDFVSNNQATTGIGCRPTRLWIMQRLQEDFGHAYQTRTQPRYADFPEDWSCPDTRLIYRAVFVGSRVPLQLPTLSTEVLDRQVRVAP